MINLESLDYKKPVLLEENILQKVYIEKTFFDIVSSDQYFIKLYSKNYRGDFAQQGYIYFAIDFLEKASWFIGTYIKPEFRGNGLSTLLISFWLQLCFENGLNNLGTIINQRKPFIIYLLKCYSFDLKNLNQYLISDSNIHICKNNDDTSDRSKYLLFENQNQKLDFLRSAVASGDSYQVLDTLPSNFSILDTVLLGNPYFLKDESRAYELSKKKFNQFKE